MTPSTTVTVSPLGPASRPTRAVVADPALLGQLMNLILDRSGLSESEIARRLGTARQSVQQYRYLKRTNPSLRWFLRYVQVCGGRLVLELPEETLE